MGLLVTHFWLRSFFGSAYKDFRFIIFWTTQRLQLSVETTLQSWQVHKIWDILDTGLQALTNANSAAAAFSYQTLYQLMNALCIQPEVCPVHSTQTISIRKSTPWLQIGRLGGNRGTDTVCQMAFSCVSWGNGVMCPPPLVMVLSPNRGCVGAAYT